MIAGLEQQQETTIAAYGDNHAYLQEALTYLDLLIRRRILIMQLDDPAHQGLKPDIQLYISTAEAGWLLNQNGAPPAETEALHVLNQQLVDLQQCIAARTQASREAGVFLPLPHLARVFGWSPFELLAVIICLAPELRRKYDKLYAYVQDDVTRKRPSVDLILDLLCETESDRWQQRPLFDESGPLLRAGILRPVPDPASPSGSSGLAQFLALDPRVLSYLLGHHILDPRLADAATLLLPVALDDLSIDDRLKQEVLSLSHYLAQTPAPLPRKLIVHLSGPEGVGKRSLAQALCTQLDCNLLHMDVFLLLNGQGEALSRLRLVFREGRIQQAAVYLDHLDVLLEEEREAAMFVKQLSAVIAEYGWLTFVATEAGRPLPAVADSLRVHELILPLPDVPLRQEAWAAALAESRPAADRQWTRPLAERYQLTPGQIRAAAAEAAYYRALGNEGAPLELDDLYAACRRQSRHRLDELALLIQPQRNWDDLILPEDKKAQLHEICSQVQHQYRVWEEWGFGRQMAYGKGLSVLFSGPPGTGKTLAAEVMAGALGLDLYKIDLSGVVSKYIGETEKNLERVFREAECSNAILFFDEADALFGKRTEVSDAHDRYANIETSYLLQRMELYQGIVILATNLRENMDEAFSRRLRFIVEFPVPDFDGRRAIWQVHLPTQAPLAKDINVDALAKHHQLADGSIRNIALNAAFLAAADEQPLGQDYIQLAARREYEKKGKLWQENGVGGRRWE